MGFSFRDDLPKCQLEDMLAASEIPSVTRDVPVLIAPCPKSTWALTPYQDSGRAVPRVGGYTTSGDRKNHRGRVATNQRLPVAPLRLGSPTKAGAFVPAPSEPLLSVASVFCNARPPGALGTLRHP